jgi:adenylate cyclase class IV
MKSVFFLFLFILSSVMSPAFSEIKREVEIKMNLKEKSFKDLRQLFLKDYKGKESQRNDYYFDLFDHSQYLLKKTDPAIKLRFMWDGLDLKWQIQQTGKTETEAFLALKETFSIDLPMSFDKSLFNAIENYHVKLAEKDPYALVLASHFQDYLVKENLLTNALPLCSLCAEATKFYSTHTNQKKRVKIKTKIAGESFEIQVGETINQGVSSFELEAEVKDSAEMKKSAAHLKNWLVTSARFNPESDIETSTPVDPTLKSEHDLNALLNHHNL